MSFFHMLFGNEEVDRLKKIIKHKNIEINRLKERAELPNNEINRLKERTELQNNEINKSRERIRLQINEINELKKHLNNQSIENVLENVSLKNKLIYMQNKIGFYIKIIKINKKDNLNMSLKDYSTLLNIIKKMTNKFVDNDLDKLDLQECEEYKQIFFSQTEHKKIFTYVLSIVFPNINTLNLTSIGLSTFPEEFNCFKNIKTIYLLNNPIKDSKEDFFEKIKSFKKLKTITTSNIGYTDIKSDISIVLSNLPDSRNKICETKKQESYRSVISLEDTGVEELK